MSHLQEAILQHAPVISHVFVAVADLPTLGMEAACCPHDALTLRVMGAGLLTVDVGAQGSLRRLEAEIRGRKGW